MGSGAKGKARSVRAFLCERAYERSLNRERDGVSERGKREVDPRRDRNASAHFGDRET